MQGKISEKVLVIVFTILVCQAFVFVDQVNAQAQDRAAAGRSFWAQFWEWLTAHTFLFSILLVTLITAFSTVMATLKKDKILKGLAGHLITIEMKDGARHRGRLRVESVGLEVVEEKADKDADKDREKISYLVRGDEYSSIHALVRYHDFLTDREREEREEDVRQVHHPSIGMRMKRRTRNVVNEMKRVATEAFTMVFGKFKERFGKYGSELEKTGQGAVEYVTSASYDALIDRLIGTRVVMRIKGGPEYIGVLKDYTKDFIEFLNVDYENKWQIKIDKGKKTRHERGLILEKKGNDIIIRSKSPFKVTLKHIYWKGGAPDAKREKINKTIEPFGQLKFSITTPALDVVVKPFGRLQLPTTYSHSKYKNITFHFESVRVADIVLKKDYGIVRHRTEKYEPKLLDFGALAEALLTSKGEDLVLEGNPSTTPLIIHNGYLTNLPRERMDFAAVDEQCNRRWTVNSFFSTLDKKLRPVSNHYFLGLLPIRKPRRVLALLALAVTLRSDEKTKNDPLLPRIYFALCNANRRGRRQFNKQQVLIKRKKRFAKLLPRLLPRFFPKPSQT